MYHLTFDMGASAALLRAAYIEHGAVLVRGLADDKLLASFRQRIVRMIEARLVSIGRPANSETMDLDQLYNELCDADRRLGSGVYDHVKELAEYYQLISSDALCDTVGTLLGTETFQMPYDLCLFRIDRPEEDKYSFDWHQDYPYNLLSQNAVTAWIPLSDVESEMGPLLVVPGSHRKMLEVTIREPHFRPGAGGGGRALELQGIHVSTLESQAQEVSAKAGDVLFFHTFLLHRSGQNRSQRSRWTANPRYGDMLDASMVSRGWRCVTRDNFVIFHEIHPEAASVVRG